MSVDVSFRAGDDVGECVRSEIVTAAGSAPTTAAHGDFSHSAGCAEMNR